MEKQKITVVSPVPLQCNEQGSTAVFIKKRPCNCKWDCAQLTVVPANTFIRCHVFPVAVCLFNIVAQYQGAFALFCFLQLCFDFNSLPCFETLTLIIIRDKFQVSHVGPLHLCFLVFLFPALSSMLCLELCTVVPDECHCLKKLRENERRKQRRRGK